MVSQNLSTGPYIFFSKPLSDAWSGNCAFRAFAICRFVGHEIMFAGSSWRSKFERVELLANALERSIALDTCVSERSILVRLLLVLF